MLRELVLNGQAVASPVSPDVADNKLAMVYIPSFPKSEQYLMGVDADYDAAVSAIKTITIKRGPATVDGLLESASLARGTTDTNVQTSAFHYVLSRTAYSKAAVAAGTALAAGTIPADKWGVYRFSINSAGTITCTAGAANFTTGYADETAALAALPALPANEVDLGHITVLTASGLAFVGGSDGLEGGSSGNVSSDTNYYDITPPTLTTIGAPMRWDFANGPFYRSLPTVIPFERDQAIVVELEASGTAGTEGRVVAWLAGP